MEKTPPASRSSERSWPRPSRGLAFLKRLKPALIVAALGLATVTAVSAGSTTTPATINACVNKATGLVRVITGTQKCSTERGFGETSLSWNEQGVPGATGPQGAAGKDGAAGATGHAGPKGDTGAAGASGAPGLKGDTGPTGAPGATGAQGSKGDIGAAGPAGLKGDAGAAGPQGAPGATGPQGLKGDKGDTGATGAAGLNGTNGMDGAIGPMGDTGAAGPIGSQGPKGDAGAAGPQGAKGDTGAVGPQGVAGKDGASGATGPQGPTGADGSVGPKGDAGSAGAQGPKGLKGDTGAPGGAGPQGLQGAAGVQGPKGDTGATGPQGPAGSMGAANAFSVSGNGSRMGLNIEGGYANLVNGSARLTTVVLGTQGQPLFIRGTSSHYVLVTADFSVGGNVAVGEVVINQGGLPYTVLAGPSFANPVPSDTGRPTATVHLSQVAIVPAGAYDLQVVGGSVVGSAQANDSRLSIVDLGPVPGQ